MRIGETTPIRQPIPLTPLVDIVFLLLMFFMLSTTFTKFGAVDLRGQPTRGGGEENASPSRASFPGVIVFVMGENRVRVNDSTISVDELAKKLDGFHQLGIDRVAVKAASSATVQDLVSVLDAIKMSALDDAVIVR